MGFLSKKSMLVSLLALSLAACAPGAKPPPPKPKETTINLPCDGNGGDNPIDKKPQTVIFQIQTGTACDLTDVNFTTHKEAFKNKKHSAATSGGAATSGDPVTFEYDGSPIPNGALFNYNVTPGSWNLLGNGSGVIK